MMTIEPQKEHQWLHRLVGEWTYEHETSMAPGEPPMKFQGTDSVRSLGGVWVICEGQGNMPGGGVGKTIMTLGYDPQKQRFVGTFIGSMMTNLWVYDGVLEGNVLTLSAEGPSFTTEGKMANYRDVIEFLSDDHRTLSAYVQGEDGSWTHFMTAHYRRTK